MFKIFKNFVVSKPIDENPNILEIKEGDISKCICPKCSTVVQTIAAYKDFTIEGKGLIKNLLTCVCLDCNTIVCPAKGTEKVIEEYINKLDKNESSTENIPKDDNEDSMNTFLSAFPIEVLNEVGKGEVSIVVSKDIVSEKIISKLWVSWIKLKDGKTVPCNEFFVLDGIWNTLQTSESLVNKLRDKIIKRSETNKISILFIQKIK